MQKNLSSVVTWTPNNTQSRHVLWEPHTNQDGIFFCVLPYLNISDFSWLKVYFPLKCKELLTPYFGTQTINQLSQELHDKQIKGNYKLGNYQIQIYLKIDHNYLIALQRSSNTQIPTLSLKFKEFVYPQQHQPRISVVWHSTYSYLLQCHYLTYRIKRMSPKLLKLNEFTAC